MMSCTRRPAQVVVRVPSILLEPGFDDFVQDLAMYGRSHDKSVTIAARGFINLVASRMLMIPLPYPGPRFPTGPKPAANAAAS